MVNKQWEIFYWKNDLLMDIDEHNFNDYIFLSQDSPSKYENGKITNVGAKKFIRFKKELLNDFLDENKKIKGHHIKKNENLYELLISDFGDVPLRPYFDLEIESETEVDQESHKRLLNLFIDWVINFFNTNFPEFDEEDNLKENNFIIFDSCRPLKLSYHIIIDGFRFTSMQHHKDFIALMQHHWNFPQNDDEKEIIEQMSWRKGTQNRFIFDTTVYVVKGQSFRLPYQSKRNSKYVLQPSGDNCVVDLKKFFIQIHSSEDIGLLFRIPDIVIPSPKDGFDCDGNTVVLLPNKKTEIIDKRTGEKINKDSNFRKNPEEPMKKGMTLYKLNNLNPEDLKDFPRWKQALYYIPNGPIFDANNILLEDGTQNWQHFFEIVSNISWNGGDLEDALLWCRLAYTEKNGFSDDNVEKIFHNAKVSTDLPILNKTLIERIAESIDPAAVDATRKYYFNKFLNINIEKDYPEIKIIIENEKTKFVSDANSEYEPDRTNIMNDAKFLIIHAGMGRGKTQAIKRLLKNEEHDQHDKDKKEYNKKRDDIINKNALINTQNEINKVKYNRKIDEIKATSEMFKMDYKEPTRPELKPLHIVPSEFTEKVFDNYYEKVLFLSSRLSFAEFVSKEFNFRLYTDAKHSLKESNNKTTLEEPRLVCSVESLHFIDSEMNYDIVIIDESESVMKQMNSDTLNGKSLNAWKFLVSLCQKAKKVVVADAFISHTSINFVQEVASKSENKSITYLRNKYISETKEMRELPLIKKNKKEPALDTFYEFLEKQLKDGKNIFACFGSATELNDTIEKLKNAKVIFDDDVDLNTTKNYLHIWSKGDDSDFNSSRNMNETWQKYKFVGVSPSITIGMSFDVKDYFDFTMIKFAPTCSVRDAFQAHMRVRYPKESVIYFQYPSDKRLNLAKGEKINEMLNIGYLEDFLKKKKSKNTQSLMEEAKTNNIEDSKIKSFSFKQYAVHAAFERNYVLCLKEDVFGPYFFKDMVHHFAQECGYTIPHTCDFESNKKSSESSIPIKPKSYIDIKTLEYREEAEEIKEKILQKESTDNEKIQLEKYYFDCRYNSNLLGDKLDDIFKFYLTIEGKKVLKNVDLEIDKLSTERLFDIICEETNSFKTENTPLRLKYILELNELLKKGAKVKSQISNAEVESNADKDLNAEVESNANGDFNDEVDSNADGDSEVDSNADGDSEVDSNAEAERIAETEFELLEFCSYHGGYYFSRTFFEKSEEGKPLFEYLSENYEKICDVFGINANKKSKSKKSESKEKDFSRTTQKIIAALNAVYNNWSKLRFKPDTTGKKSNSKNKQFEWYVTETILCREMFLLKKEEYYERVKNNKIEPSRYEAGTCFINLSKTREEFEKDLQSRLLTQSEPIYLEIVTLKKMSYGVLCKNTLQKAKPFLLRGGIYVINENGFEVGQYIKDKKIVIFYDNDDDKREINWFNFHTLSPIFDGNAESVIATRVNVEPVNPKKSFFYDGQTTNYDDEALVAIPYQGKFIIVKEQGSLLNQSLLDKMNAGEQLNYEEVNVLRDVATFTYDNQTYYYDDENEIIDYDDAYYKAYYEAYYDDELKNEAGKYYLDGVRLIKDTPKKSFIRDNQTYYYDEENPYSNTDRFTDYPVFSDVKFKTKVGRYVKHKDKRTPDLFTKI